ncbi:Ada metal-binding domain-containing protein [Sphingobacterium endophyticum]|uniref:Ada metal-binding domain-containing protein n=1 Tax=Sphingobacterium endophyticum TaxID=2546448 RepID=UPI0012E2C439|nr:Ada metal-binding domain-containing protein [Sphingobacterium endophyticum]
MIEHQNISDEKLRTLIRSGAIKSGGNQHLKIYGTLDCKSGKRMKRVNRVFFETEEDALEHGFRPCGSCMHKKYLEWTKCL